MRKLLWCCAIVLLAPSVALSQSAGDWALARWNGGEYFYPGVVESRNGNKVTIAYDDGGRETLSANKVKPYNWTVGGRVQCRWKSGDTWYDATITKMNAKDGTRVNVRYDDGISERSRTRLCRSR